jgi:hypothetical protein
VLLRYVEEVTGKHEKKIVLIPGVLPGFVGYFL